MKNLFFFTIIILLLSCRQKKHETTQVIEIEKYKSLTCDTGVITLTLKSDSSFNLNILLQSDNPFPEKDSIIGNWIKKDSILILNSDNNKIIYSQMSSKMEMDKKNMSIKTYIFKSNDRDFFGTGYHLFDEESVSNFFKPNN